MMLPLPVRPPNSLRGFSTLELLLALMIMSTSIACVLLVTLGIPEALADGHRAETGEALAAAGIDKELIRGIHAYSSVISIASSTSGIYTSSLVATILPDGLTKELVSMVSWKDEKGFTRYSKVSGIVTDFADASADSCGNVLIGDWTHPLIRNLAMTPGNLLPLGSSLSMHPISSLAIGSSTLLAAVTNSVSKTDPILFLFDISSSTDPRYLGSLDTATSTRTGFSGITEHDDFIYAASAYAANFTECSSGPTCSQLQIIDASLPRDPKLLSYFQLPTTTPPFAIGTGSQSAGKSIFYANDRIYLGLQKTGIPGGDEFNIINVQDPHAPVWIGGYAIGRTVNQIKVVDDYAYLATDDPHRELVILDVHDPSHITVAGSYDPPGNTTSGFGEAVSVASTTVALGRSYIYTQPELILLKTSSDTTPSVISSENINTAATESIENILIRGFLIFVLTNTSLQYWDISNAEHPVPYGPRLVLPGKSSVLGTNALACRNNTLYVASSDSTHTGYLTVITGS